MDLVDVDEYVRAGRLEGHQEGLKRGLEEGLRLGWKAGADLAASLAPIIKLALEHRTTDRGRRLLEEALAFPLTNDEDAEKEARWARLEAKYKEMVAISGNTIEIVDKKSLSF